MRLADFSFEFVELVLMLVSYRGDMLHPAIAQTQAPAFQRSFHLGGAVPNTSVIDFGSNAASLLRGFGSIP